MDAAAAPAAMRRGGGVPGALRGGVPSALRRAAARPAAAARVPVRAGGGLVSFSVKKHVKFGQSLRVVGSAPELGSWDPARAPELTWQDGDVWTGTVTLPAGTEAAFKFVVVGGDQAEWEEGDDRRLTGGEEIGITVEWGRRDRARKHSEREHASASDSDDDVPTASAAVAPADELVLAMAGADGRWQGKEVTFMRSNEHSGSRRGGWKPEGLNGAAKALVDGDMRAGSWLQKLEVVAGLVGVDRSQALDDLACAAIYLQWVSTGVIECTESGGHQRPNRAATVARGIFINMERALGDAYGNPGVDEAPRLAARRILPWLPSFSGEFTCAVPLTRIRDIAHRNDIPHDLKQEIKHTIQNKLHRNAGPEDLVATEKMLARITAQPGQYNAAFVSEFRIFHAELKDFFNAKSTMERLDAIEAGLDESGKGALGALRAAKGALDAATPAALADWARAQGGGTPGAGSARERELVLSALHATTALRACLVAKLTSGLRNDASDDAIAARQAWRAAEQALEGYAFVLASRSVGTLEAEGGAAAMAPARGAAAAWGPALTTAVLCVRQLGLSGFRGAECAAVEAGLAAARDAPGLGADVAAALRVKAAAQRARRLTEAHAVALVEALGARGAALGRGLGVADSASRVVAEAEVRASVAFALSNAVTLLLRAAAAAAGAADGTECVVGGEAVGTLREVDRLQPGAVPPDAGRTVLLLRAADGDEEVGAAGADVAGILLLQELPHLSHLAVRARQERVVLATSAEEGPAAAARQLLGKRVRLRATPERVTLEAYDGPDESGDGGSAAAAASSSAAAAAPPAAAPGKVVRVERAALVPLPEAVAPSCGAKAATCGELARVAARVAASSPPDAPASPAFDTPPGVVLPFGCMEAALRDAGTLDRYEQLLTQLQAASPDGGALDAACADMHALLAAARPPAELLAAAAAALPKGVRCVVRSSANVEDLAGMSGAGLYESVTGVQADDAGALGAAVGAVWASLHTRRAVLARRAARVPQAAAAMAVLIQEMVPCTHSFVLHTAAPGRPSAVLAEVAVGLGETLASGTRGAAWRLEADAPEAGGAVRTLGFANLSTALVPRDGGVATVTVDYSKQPLSGAADARAQLGAQLGAVGRALAAELGAPQDVEGGLVGTRVFVVQSRPQPL